MLVLWCKFLHSQNEGVGFQHARDPHQPVSILTRGPFCPCFWHPLLLFLHANCPSFCWAPPALTDPLRLRKSTEVSSVGFFVYCPLTPQGGGRVHVQGLRGELVNLFEFILLSTWGLPCSLGRGFKHKTPLYEILPLLPPIFREEVSLNPFQIQRN